MLSSISRIFILSYFGTMAMISCISCAGFDVMEIGPVDPAFDVYVDKYSEAKAKITGNAYTKNISIEFYSLEGSIIGLCRWLSSGQREIYIDPTYWFSDYTTDLDRQLLIFHELGHCDLDRDHADPSSILEPYHLGGGEYFSNIEYYNEELFDASTRVDLTSSSSFKINDHDGACGGIVKEIEVDK